MQDLVRYALYGIPLCFCFYVLETLFILLSVQNLKKVKLGKFYFRISLILSKLYKLSLDVGLVGVVMYCLSKLI